MATPTPPADIPVPATDAPPAPEPAFPCESCGEMRARYVLADLEQADTSLFCGSCLTLTFARVANDMFAEQS